MGLNWLNCWIFDLNSLVPYRTLSSWPTKRETNYEDSIMSRFVGIVYWLAGRKLYFRWWCSMSNFNDEFRRWILVTTFHISGVLHLTSVPIHCFCAIFNCSVIRVNVKRRMAQNVFNSSYVADLSLKYHSIRGVQVLKKTRRGAWSLWPSAT